MTIGDRIKYLREQQGLTQEELAKKLGYKSKSSVAHIENGRDIPRSMVVKLATVLDSTPAYLMGWEEEAEKADDLSALMQKYDNIKPIKLKRFPMLGEIACGEPIFADEDKEHFVMADMEIHADFCLTAKGDSMINARIHNGDIVFIREMPMVENGDIAAIIIDDEATLKRVYYYPDDGMLQLIAENPVFKPLVYQGEELNHIRILGKAVYFMSALK
jgi:repressor LexA